ncbi:hypothetical protein R1flu_022262 [Riccia fluitans]|uniref:Omega-hydroxypalmitate O-feruloyl transferase n=1 Tax=Riccia fluitans TaxID=41844 RepID=A0ABD1ZRR1_9MARC
MAFGRAELNINGVRVRPRNIRKFDVPPAEPTAAQNEWLYLSNLDRVVTPTFSSVIHFYEKVVTEERSFEEVTDVLKRSLSNVLVDFFPLAGRLELGKDGLINLHCNDAGAVFVEMSLEVELEEVGGPQPMDILSGLEVARLGKGPFYIPDQLTPMPTLVVQVTRFKCGAIAVATNWHHTVADGSSGVHFIKSWGEIAQGKPLTLVPNHDRLLLTPRNPPNPNLVQGYSTKTTHNLNHVMERFTTSKEPAVIKTFFLEQESIRQLKEQANTPLDSDADSDSKLENSRRPSFTSAESISGHLWQNMARARRDPDQKKGDSAAVDAGNVTKFFMFVDGRKKLNVPAGYFGNVVCSACAVTTEEELLQNPVSYAAGLISRACKNITGEYFRSLIDWVEMQGTAPSKSEHVNSVGRDVASTFWVFFPLYEIDLGFGRPIWAARNSPPRPLIDGIAVMPSPQGPRSMLALLNLHPDRMDRIQRDPQFSSVFINTEARDRGQLEASSQF